MRNLFLILILSLCFIDSGYAQKKKTSYNDLKRELSSNKKDTSTVSALLDLGYYYYERAKEVVSVKNKDSAAVYANSAKSLSKSLQFEKGQGRSELLLSKIAEQKGQQNKAVEFARAAIAIFEKTGTKTDLADACLALASTYAVEDAQAYTSKALKIYKESHNKLGEANAVKIYGISLMNAGKIPEGIEELKKSLPLFQSAGFKEVQFVYSMISIGYNEIGKLTESLEYALKAVALVEKLNDTSNQAAEIYNYTAITYKSLKDLEKTREYLIKAYTISSKFDNTAQMSMLENNLVQTLMNLKRNSEATVYLKKMEARYPSFPESVKSKMATRFILAYSEMGDFKRAEKYVAFVSFVAAKMSDDNPEKVGLYSALTKYYFRSKDYQNARKYGEALQKICEEHDYKLMLQQVHQTLFSIDSTEAKFTSAISHYKKMQIIGDSLFNETKNKQIAELQVQYDTDKKDQNNKLLTKQNELQHARLTQSNLIKNISIGGVLLLLAFLGVLYSRYKIKQRSNKLLEEQKNEIDSKNNSLQKLVVEKEWLLKEIHHRVKNNLQIIMSLLNTQSYFLKDDAAMAAIRNSQHRIHSMSLIHKKLYQSDNVVAIDMPTYVRDLVEYFRSFFETGSKIQFKVQVDPIELDITQSVPLGLILNEAITNSIKHAFPDDRNGTIHITMIKTDVDRIALSISDNGIGMRDTDSDTSSSLGMKLINGFSRDLEADLTIDGKEGLSIELEFTVKTVDFTTIDTNNLSA